MQALEPLMMLGLAAVALWIHVRYPRLRPRTLVRATIHVAVAFGLFNFVPYALHLCLALPAPASLLVFIPGILMPSLLYVLLSWLWLVARLNDLAKPTPRSGHPVTATGD